jgi:hypothetical protein
LLRRFPRLRSALSIGRAYEPTKQAARAIKRAVGIIGANVFCRGGCAGSFSRHVCGNSRPVRPV